MCMAGWYTIQVSAASARRPRALPRGLYQGLKGESGSTGVGTYSFRWIGRFPSAEDRSNGRTRHMDALLPPRAPGSRIAYRGVAQKRNVVLSPPPGRAGTSLCSCDEARHVRELGLVKPQSVWKTLLEPNGRSPPEFARQAIPIGIIAADVNSLLAGSEWLPDDGTATGSRSNLGHLLHLERLRSSQIEDAMTARGEAQ